MSTKKLYDKRIFCHSCDLAYKEETMFIKQYDCGLVCLCRKCAKKLAEEIAEKYGNEYDYTLDGVMHFVDKWLDGDELKQDEVNRAATMREKTLQIVEAKQVEIERLNKEVDRLSQVVLYHDGQMVDIIKEFAERARGELQTGNIIMDKSIKDIIYNLANKMVEQLK